MHTDQAGILAINGKTLYRSHNRKTGEKPLRVVPGSRLAATTITQKAWRGRV
jgi:hypothetical protein